MIKKANPVRLARLKALETITGDETKALAAVASTRQAAMHKFQRYMRIKHLRMMAQKLYKTAEQNNSEVIPGLATSVGTSIGVLAGTKKGKILTRGPIGAALGYIAGTLLKANKTKRAKIKEELEVLNKQASIFKKKERDPRKMWTPANLPTNEKETWHDAYAAMMGGTSAGLVGKASQIGLAYAAEDWNKDHINQRNVITGLKKQMKDQGVLHIPAKYKGQGYFHPVLNEIRSADSAEVIAHELGHLKTYKSIGLGQALLRGIGPVGASLAGTAVLMSDPDSKTSKYAPAVAGAGYLPTIAEEAVASTHAVKNLRELGLSSKNMLKAKKSLFGFALPTYILGAGLSALAPYLITQQRKKFKHDKIAALKGGLAEKAGKTEKDFNPKSVAQGAKVESEHTSNKALRKEIAMDHLTEDPQYYKKLSRMEKAAALTGLYRDAFAGAHVKHFEDYKKTFDQEDQNMTNYMHQLMKNAVLSYGNDEGSAVQTQLTEFEINNNAFRKTKNMTGLPKGTDWGYRHSKSAMLKKAVQTLTLESEDPKFMERDYQQRSQNSRWLREVNRSSDSIRAPF